MVRCVWSAGDSFSYPMEKYFPCLLLVSMFALNTLEIGSFFTLFHLPFFELMPLQTFPLNDTLSIIEIILIFFILHWYPVTESFLKDGNKKAAEKKVLCLIAWLGITEALFYLIYFYNCYSCLRGEANRCIVQLQVQLYMWFLRQVKLSALSNTVRHT